MVARVVGHRFVLRVNSLATVPARQAHWPSSSLLASSNVHQGAVIDLLSGTSVACPPRSQTRTRRKRRMYR